MVNKRDKVAATVDAPLPPAQEVTAILASAGGAPR